MIGSVTPQLPISLVLELTRLGKPHAYHTNGDEASQADGIRDSDEENEAEVLVVGRLEDLAAERDTNQGSIMQFTSISRAYREFCGRTDVHLPKAANTVHGRKCLSVVLCLAQLSNAHRHQADATAASKTKEHNECSQACRVVSKRKPHRQHRH